MFLAKIRTYCLDFSYMVHLRVAGNVMVISDEQFLAVIETVISKIKHACQTHLCVLGCCELKK